MVFIYLKQSVALHFSQFIGQGAAIYAEIIRQLLTVKGDREVRALGLRSLDGEVGYQASADGFGGGMENPSGKIQVFCEDMVRRRRINLLWWTQALGQDCRIRAPFKNRISEGSEATALTMRGSPGRKA